MFESKCSRFALLARDVQTVVEGTEWHGAAVVDPSACLELDETLAPERVVVMNGAGGPLPLLLRGRLQLVAVDAGELLAVPPLALPSGLPAFLSGVVAARGSARALLLDPDLLSEVCGPRAPARAEERSTEPC